MTKRSKSLLIFVLIGVVVFAGFSVYADLGALQECMSGFAWWAFFAALGLAMVNYALRFLRWHFYLQAAETQLSLAKSIQIFLSGFALSVTPGKLGELIKCYFLKEFSNIPIARSAPWVVAERVTDLAALLVLGVIGVSAYGVAQATVLSGVAVVGAGLLVLAWPRVAVACIRVLTTPRLTRRLRERLMEFYAGLALLVRPWPLTWATSLAVLAWLAECLGFSLIIAAFPGTEVPLGLAILIYATTTVAGALSFLPGGLLVTEAAMTALLVQVSRGVDEPVAVAATILTRLATLWFAVMIGVVALSLLRRGSPKADRALDSATREADS